MGEVILEDVTKQYEDVTAVDHISLDIEDGEFVTFVGPSGCGKSTTLETIAGLTRPTSGTITIAGRDVTNLPPKDRGIAMVFQNIALFPHMNVYKNISFGLRLRDYDDEEIDRRVQRAVDVLQLEGMLERMPDELSGGQRQRVAIGRAIVRQPDVFLMDEPLANLDAKLRVHMRTELQRLHNQLDATIIYVTHDQAEAMTMSHRIAVMDAGKLQQFAPPLVCYNEPANLFVAGFIGSPSMNFIEGTVRDGRVELPSFSVDIDADELEELAGAEDVTLGIRPEDIYLAEQVESVTHPSEPIATRTDVIEPMGDEIFVYLLTGDETDGEMGGVGDDDEPGRADQLLMSVEPDTEIRRGVEAEVVVDRRKAHLFDAHTGEALIHGLIDGQVQPATSGTEAEGD